MKKPVQFILVSSIMLLVPLLASAHQPRMVTGNSPVQVEKPLISKAYYAELRGDEQEYIVTANDQFSLYLNLLVPDISTARKDFTIYVVKGDRTVLTLDGTKSEWKPYFEEFGHDTYLQGPEQLYDVDAGTYRIIVDNPDHAGKYVLVVGKNEEFPFSEAISAARLIPKIKQDFFGKSFWSIFESPYISVPVGILAVFILIVGWSVKR